MATLDQADIEGWTAQHGALGVTAQQHGAHKGPTRGRPAMRQCGKQRQIINQTSRINRADHRKH